MSFLRNFRGALTLSVASLVLAIFYGALTADAGAAFAGAGLAALVTTGILGVLEFTFSMDNAVVNAEYVERLDAKWQRWFLTVGLLIAVVGMRLLFPLVVVGLTWARSPP